MALHVDVELDEGISGLARVYPVGSLDTSTAGVLEAHLDRLLDDEAVTTIVLDLKDLTFITSAGLRVIVATRKRLAARNGSVAIGNPQPQVAKVFEIVKSLPGVSVFQNVAELDEYLMNIQRKVYEEERDKP
jgi:anti-anti-sigma factor